MSNLRTTGARCVVGYVSAMCKEVIEDGENGKSIYNNPLGVNSRVTSFQESPLDDDKIVVGWSLSNLSKSHENPNNDREATSFL